MPRTELLEVSRNGCLRGDDTLGLEELDKLYLARDLVVLERLGDHVLALRFR